MEEGKEEKEDGKERRDIPKDSKCCCRVIFYIFVISSII